MLFRSENKALAGKLVPAEPMLHDEIRLLLLPRVSAVEKVIVPKLKLVLDPKMLQLIMVLNVASAKKRMVLVVRFNVLVLEIVKAFPPEFNPLIVTLSAPFKSMSEPLILPDTVKLPPEGLMLSDVHVPAFNTADDVSVVLARIETLMLALVCAPPLIAAKAENKSGYEPLPDKAPDITTFCECNCCDTNIYDARNIKPIIRFLRLCFFMCVCYLIKLFGVFLFTFLLIFICTCTLKKLL